jgi:signal peptidase II
MADLNRQDNCARPDAGRTFLEHRPFVRPSLAAHLLFWPSIIIGLALDLWSKNAVFNWLQRRQHSGVSIIDGFLQLVTAQNAGAAFGMAAGQRRLLIAVSLIALMIILVVFLFSATKQKVVYLALGLLAAGVCGNLYDRIFNNGLVRDFIDIVYWPGRHWPAFNIADTMLCIAVGLLVLSSLFTGRSSRKHAHQHR